MDFFRNQEDGRRIARRLSQLFAISAVSTGFWPAVMFAGVVLIACKLLDVLPDRSEGLVLILAAGVAAFALPFTGIVSLIGAGMFLRTRYLAKRTGADMAGSFGAEVVAIDTDDAKERLLVDLVDETSRNARCVPPSIYVQRAERAVNAFSIGHSQKDAVLCVTQGCLERVSDIELQAIVAHEIAHLQNGDLEVRGHLDRLIFGMIPLVVLAAGKVERFRHRDRTVKWWWRLRDRAILLLWLAAAGGNILITGIGTKFAFDFAARPMAKRDLLADATAAQLVGSSQGLIALFRRYYQSSEAGRVLNARFATYSFWLFAKGRYRGYRSHPLEQVRIDELSVSEEGTAICEDSADEVDSAEQQLAVGVVGTESVEVVDYSISLEPESLAIRDLTEAQALMIAMLLSRDPSQRTEEFKVLRRTLGSLANDWVRRYHSRIEAGDATDRLDMIYAAIPCLRQQSREEYLEFRSQIESLVMGWHGVGLMQFAEGKIVTAILDRHFGLESPRSVVRHRKMKGLTKQASTLISRLSRHSPEPVPSLEPNMPAFDAGALHLHHQCGCFVDYYAADDCSLDKLDLAIVDFEKAAPKLKRELLAACAKTVIQDDKLTDCEMELIQALAGAIGCPVEQEMLELEIG